MKSKKELVKIIVIFIILYYLIVSKGQKLGEILFVIVSLYEKYIVKIQFFILELLHKNIVSIHNILTFSIVVIYTFYTCKVIMPKIEEVKTCSKGRLEKKSIIKLIHKILKKLLIALTSQVLLLISLVYSYGVASTGTDIKGLHGIAQVNATLAYLGGGALTDKGGGKALGYKVLAYIFLLTLVINFITDNLKVLIKKIKVIIINK